METMFFILDTEGNIVGNRKGYRTMKGAKSALRYNGAKLHHELETKAHNLYWGTGLLNPMPAYIWKIKALPVT